MAAGQFKLCIHPHLLKGHSVIDHSGFIQLGRVVAQQTPESHDW